MTDFPLYITAWTAAILATLFFVLTFTVIFERRSKSIIHGDNNDKTTMRRIRGHANAAEQIPMTLIMLGLAEYLNGHTFAMIIAALLILGRFLHAAYFNFGAKSFRFRQFGMMGTLMAQIIAIIAVAYGLLS